MSATRTVIRSVVDFAYSGIGSLADVKKQKQDLDSLRRAAYNNDLEALFENRWPVNGKEKLLVPDKTIQNAVTKFSFIFPQGTAFHAQDENVETLLKDIIEATRLDKKLQKITTEASLMGFCGLRSVWQEAQNLDLNKKDNWIIEVKPKEQLRIETDPVYPDTVIAIGLVYQFWDADGKLKWYKERWTNTEFWLWEPIEVNGFNAQQEPEFPAGKANVQPNTFGEIPITLVVHKWDTQEIGCGIVRKDDILLARALVRLRNKQHYAHLEHMDPSTVVLNGESDGPIERGPGAVINIQSNAGENPPSVSLLEFHGIPSTVKEEIMDLVQSFYRNAGLTPPSIEELAKFRIADSGVALRIKDADEVKTMEALRGDGYAAVIQHLEKLLRMGSRTRKLPAYSAVNPTDPETYGVTAKYPAFHEPTPAEQQIVLTILGQSHLPPEEKAKREALIFNIEDQSTIDEIQSNIEQAAAMQDAAANATAMLAKARSIEVPASKKPPTKSPTNKPD